MFPDGMSDLAALIYGGGILVAFSYTRFNRISYETGRRLDRLVNFLTPDKLRARRQVGFAYFIYTLVLVLTYLVLCAYADLLLPLIGAQAILPDQGASGLPAPAGNGQSIAVPSATADVDAILTTGFAPLGEPVIKYWTDELQPSETVTTNKGDSDSFIEPQISLGLALIMVGLAPAIPALERADEWLRMVAHRMAGIPTWVIDASDNLRSNAGVLGIFRKKNGKIEDNEKEEETKQRVSALMVSPSDVELMRKLRDEARLSLGNFDDFCLNIEVIFVAAAWFLDENLHVSNSGDKLRFTEMEDELRRRKDALISMAEGELSRENLENLAVEADLLASDFCVLIALYDEHGVIQPFSRRPSANARQKEARERLQEFLKVLHDSRTEPMLRQRGTTLALFWTLAIVMTWTAAWALLWPGAAEFNLIMSKMESSPYERMLNYSASAFNSYGLAIIVAITLRWLRDTDETGDGLWNWENLRYPSHWTRWLPQAAMLVFAAWAFSTLMMLATYVFLSGLLKHPAKAEEVWVFVQLSFEYNSPVALRGAILSLMVVILLDARQRLWIDAFRYKRGENPRRTDPLRLARNARVWSELSLGNSFVWATIGAVVMMMTGALTRYLSFLAASRGNRAFDAIDAGLMIWATLNCTILGALVMFCVSEALSGRSFVKLPAQSGGSPDNPAAAET